MEIIYLTDIHDDIKRLRHVLLNTKADLYIISGDLIYKAFFTEKLLYEFVYIQEEFYAHLVKNQIQGTPSELAFSINKTPGEFSKDFQDKAERYNQLFQKASSNMKAKYQILKNIVDKYAKADLIFLPGNYDLDLQYTALYPYDLHKKCKTIDDIKFCGYGGAPIATSGIPELLSVVFYEYSVDGELHSEPKKFFESSRPDIMVLHNPAYGTLDKLSSYGRVGSQGIRAYIDENHPALVLSGHVHSDYGILKIDKTLCINPSNFGNVDTLNGHDHGGYFCKISLDKKEKIKINSVTLYRIGEKHVNELAQYTIGENLEITPKIYIQDEINKLGEFIK